MSTIREKTQFIVWFLLLMVCVGLGTAMATSAVALALPGIMLPFVFMWLTGFVPAAGPVYESLRNPSAWPCSPRMLLGMLVGGMFVIYAILVLTLGLPQ